MSIKKKRSPLRQSVIRRIIRSELKRRRATHQRYSLRAFAGDIDFSSSHLSEVLNGKRALSLEAAMDLVAGFGHAPEKTRELQNELLNAAGARAEVVRRRGLGSIESNPMALAILALLANVDIKNGATEIAERLGVLRSDVEPALRLLRQERFVGVQNGELVGLVEPPIVQVGDGTNNLNFSSVTVAVDPKRLPEARIRIEKFLREMRDLFDSGNPDRIFELQVQLYPWAVAEGSPRR